MRGVLKSTAALFVLAGVGLAFYFRHEKTRLAEERCEFSPKTSPYFSITTLIFPKKERKKA